MSFFSGFELLNKRGEDRDLAKENLRLKERLSCGWNPQRVIASFVACHMTRIKYVQMQRSATMISCSFRSFINRKTFLEMKRAALVLSSFFSCGTATRVNRMIALQQENRILRFKLNMLQSLKSCYVSSRQFDSKVGLEMWFPKPFAHSSNTRRLVIEHQTQVMHQVHQKLSLILPAFPVQESEEEDSQSSSDAVLF